MTNISANEYGVIKLFILEKPKHPNVIEIYFDYWENIDPLGPFWDIVMGYAAETGIMPKVVDHIYNYKFVENGYKIQFYWNAVMRVYIFYVPNSQYQMVYDRLNRICTDLNRRIAERKYFEKYGELPNKGRGFM